MIVINNKKIEEKLEQLKKAIEIIGGKGSLKSDNFQSEGLLNNILENIFENKDINIDSKNYSIDDLFKIKTEYEKYILKNKAKTVQAIVFKIKKYDTRLDSLVRKYKKSKSIEEYNKITKDINDKYRKDINSLILNNISTEVVMSLEASEDEIYYGEYLLQKRKALVDAVISKLGIV